MMWRPVVVRRQTCSPRAYCLARRKRPPVLGMDLGLKTRAAFKGETLEPPRYRGHGWDGMG